MGSLGSKENINKLSEKCIINGRSKEEIITVLQCVCVMILTETYLIVCMQTQKAFAAREHPTFYLIRYGQHFVMKDKNANKVKKRTKATNYTIGAVASIPAMSTGAEIGTGIGMLAGGPFGGGLGFVVGTAVGAVGTAAVTRSAHKAEMKKFGQVSWHHFIVIEYGQKLMTRVDEFGYEFFIRIEFSNHGYSVCTDRTDKFWKIFEEERHIKRAYLGEAEECNGNIYTLIAAIKETESQYNVMTSNCQHFAKHIWKHMVSMENI